ncbi:MAG: glutathione S-transferase N-terminal domain-containing protein [Oceanicaulis sp.]|uniref:glutathione S-transferase N-terminal domain-containing protein n=1 Tax=Glycocaulis sp. TaxID=1969725 RepID=UPI0025BFC7D8|nr:glutathione S-transferase N-terminal domain-containing protein [Glycocaulis sp.]MCC5982432.1 glutathione S-transferase N-terminal domain-containing protein [Oceanicaulis sp.]MCH8521263.1 glutathione S-transferase N-terminal domain-containing protein [Glycocaulis sp.]
MPQAPIEVFYWPTPNGWKITIALEEMGLPYVIRPVNIGAGEQFRPEFLAISPNNRMPAITDPEGPDGKPISIFESGAILQYLGRKTGKFYGANAREQAEVEQWLFWQMGGLGPMAGQAHHFRSYAKKIEPDETKLEYGATRYTNEVSRLYGVMDRRLADRDYLAGAYSIADMAAWPWILPEGQGQNLEDFPNLKAWVERLKQRPALRRGRDAGKELRVSLAEDSEEAKKARAILFGQKAL